MNTQTTKEIRALGIRPGDTVIYFAGLDPFSSPCACISAALDKNSCTVAALFRTRDGDEIKRTLDANATVTVEARGAFTIAEIRAYFEGWCEADTPPTGPLHNALLMLEDECDGIEISSRRSSLSRAGIERPFIDPAILSEASTEHPQA